MRNLPSVNHRFLVVNQSIGVLFAHIISLAEQSCSVVLFTGVRYLRTSKVARLLSWFVFTFQLAFHLLLFGHVYKSLLIVSNPPFAPLLAPLARRPYFLILYDLYPQILSQLQPRNPLLRHALSLLTKVWHVVNGFVLRKANRVFTLTSAMADQLRPYFPSEELWNSKVVVIPPWADVSTMRPSPNEAQAFREVHDISGLVVSYSGNMGITHPLEILVDAAALLEGLAISPQIQILLIGEGAKRIALQQQADELKLPCSRVRFLNRLPYNLLAASLSAADLAVVALDGPASSASLPSKTFNALACGTPLLALAPANSALSQLVCHHRCGVVIHPGPDAPTQLVDAILNLKANPDELQELGENALAASYHYTPANAERLIDAWLGPLPLAA
ncbi:glycosyltransferase family 4 protein [bacterium]|nr:glycosyltransferase family 4 protein [bacterium]